MTEADIEKLRARLDAGVRILAQRAVDNNLNKDCLQIAANCALIAARLEKQLKDYL